MATPSNKDVLLKLQQLLQGCQGLPSGADQILATESYTPAQLVARIQVSLDAEEAVQTALGQFHDAVTACRKVRGAEAEFLTSLQQRLRGAFRDSETVLATFGLAPYKPRPPRTTEQKLLIKAKIQATRKERGTLGPKQRAAIHGDVTGVVIAPVTGKE